MKENKFSIIMPTYNDANTIIDSIESIRIQTYKNWELIVVNDGSTDNTEETVTEYIQKNGLSDKIKYLYQENADQLNAIKSAIPYITGDYVYILHSDDILFDEDVLSKAEKTFNEFNVDGFIPKRLPTMNNKKEVGIVYKIDLFKNKNYIIPKLAVNCGANFYIDFGFFKKNAFLSDFYHNYLEWNRPFWCNVEKNNLINIKSVDFEFFKYRVFEGNYINSDLGKLNVFNGQLRTIIDILANYSIPFFKLQSFLIRVYNKFNLRSLYIPFYFKKGQKNKYKIIKFMVDRYFKNSQYKNNIFFDSLLSFYKTKNNREINGNSICDIEVYKGSDMRKFNKQLIENNLPKEYLEFFDEMKKGFRKVRVSAENVDKMKDILHFLCINNEVEIVCE